MVWLNSISELQYYNQPIDIPCYCSTLIYANDMTLQGSFPASSGSYTLVMQTLSADGLTTYETSTANFGYYFGVNPITAEHFFNARLNAFTSIMCTYACYIIHATVTDNITGVIVFDKYTERYCQASCCDIARDITFAQDGIDGGVGVADNPTTATGVAPVLPPSLSKVSECGDPIITLRTAFTCYDYFDGYYYAIPNTVLSGDATFSYQRITNMRGKIAKRPRSIERTYSFNCRLQRVESQRVYVFEGYEYFPAWAADEIESQLHSNVIYVDDVQYQFNGGTPFSMASDCKDVFRLKTELADCVQRQVFGCNTDCVTTNFDGAARIYIVPSAYQDGYFYSEDRQLIAQNYDELLDYFRGLDGAVSVAEVATSPLSCEVFGAFTITGYGYIPSSFYYDYPINSNRVFGTVLDSVDEICPTYGVTCASPVTGAYYVEEQICAAPVTGSYYVEDDNSDVINITGYGDWSNDGTSGGTVDSGVATITIGVGNPFLIANPDSPAAPVFVNGDIIAVIGSNGRPDITLYFDSDNSILPEDVSVSIEPNGFVRYYGEATDTATDQAIITIENLVYYLINTNE